MRMNSPEGKSVLALVRDAPFAHAGEAEAITLTLAPFSKDPSRRVLDAGCGLGGTAEFVRAQGWGQVTGFDIDAVSIEKAQKNYPFCSFLACDVAEIASFCSEPFDLIYSFNAFYAFPSQPGALRSLAQVARPGADLVVFEYTDPTGRFDSSEFRRREDATFWQPLHPATVKQWSAEAGWKLERFQDLSPEYVRWYRGLVERIDNRREVICRKHGETVFRFVLSFYAALLDTIEQGVMGGGIFYLTRNSRVQ